MSEKITLSGVPETMLQTVYARARESAGRGAIRDEKAEQLIGSLDYDFSLAEKDTAMRSGVIARTIVLDRLVGAWLGRHPGAIVVNLACGLDTRCYRMKGYQHWYCDPGRDQQHDKIECASRLRIVIVPRTFYNSV